jgi:hypothetical protein
MNRRHVLPGEAVVQLGSKGLEIQEHKVDLLQVRVGQPAA